MLDVDFIFIRDFEDTFHDKWMVAGAVGDTWALAEFHEAEFHWINSRGIGGVSDIKAYAQVWLESIGSHHGAVAADFFLNRVKADEGDGRLFAGGGDAFHHLGDDVGAKAVIKSTGNDALVSELGRAVLVDHGVADANAHLCDFLGIRCADIDPEIVDGGSFFAAEFIAAEVDCGVSHNSKNDAFVAKDIDATPSGGGSIGTADAVDTEEAFVIDVLDDVADLVRVSLEHDDFFGLPFESGPSGAVGITLDLGGGVFEIVRPDALARHFETGGGWGFEEVEEKFFVGFFHVRKLSTAKTRRCKGWELRIFTTEFAELAKIC